MSGFGFPEGRPMPFCTRSGVAELAGGRRSERHYCDELCPLAPGQPCVAPAGSWWRPRPNGLAVEHYRMLRAALPTHIVLTERQERYLRWFAKLADQETAEVFAELFEGARECAPHEKSPPRKAKRASAVPRRTRPKGPNHL